jgi:putative transposase
MAAENSKRACCCLSLTRWKLGFEVSATTIRTVLNKHGIPPSPERSYEDSSWRTLLNHYREQILACDFFTVETLTLKTLHVLSYFEHATRRVYLVGCTAHPNKVWVIQQARQTAWQLEDREKPI